MPIIIRLVPFVFVYLPLMCLLYPSICATTKKISHITLTYVVCGCVCVGGVCVWVLVGCELVFAMVGMFGIADS